MPNNRGKLFTDRTTAQRELQNLVELSQELKSKYIEAKNGKPNESRINDIDKTLLVITLIRENLEANGIAIDHSTKANVSNDILRTHISLYKGSVSQLKGAILNLENKIEGQYSGLTGFFTSKENSALYRLLSNIVAPTTMGEDQSAIDAATKTCIDAYKLLITDNPEQEISVEDTSASEAYSPSSSQSSPAL